MKTNKLGFTLIELLAVVLIIGIMTSIALPQYRRSITRAEAMEAMVNLRTIFDSAKRYKSVHSEAPTKLKGLDIAFFDATSDDNATFNIGRFQYTFDTANNRISACRIANPIDYCFHFYYRYPNPNTGEKDILTCQALNPNGKYGWLCGAIGSYETSTGSNEYYIDKKSAAQ